MIKKCVIYARVSSREQEKGYSISAQLKFLKEYAKNNSFIIEKEFIESETAKKAGRTKFNEMIKFLKINKKSIKTILCEKTDRLYRNFKDYVTLDEIELDLHLVKENIVLNKDSRSHEKFIHGIKVLMAKNYIDNLSEEIRKGIKEKCEQGSYPKNAPFGYLNDKKTKNISPDPDKAYIVKKMYEMYATGEYSIRSLGDTLYKKGLTTTANRKIPKSTIERILKNSIYYGEFQYHDKIYKGKYIPIISKSLFIAVQEVFLGYKHIQKKRSFTFSGLMKCANCGCNITAEIKKEKYVYYHCTNSKENCNKKYVKEEIIEKHFDNIVKNVEIDDELALSMKTALITSHKEISNFRKKEIIALQRKYNKIQERLDKMYIDKLDGFIDQSFFEKTSSKWQTELNKIDNTISRYKVADKKYMEYGNIILELSKRAYSLYCSQSSEEKRKLLNILLSNCLLNGENVVPVYRKPFDILKEIKGCPSEWR